MSYFTDATEVEKTETYLIYVLTKDLAKEFQKEITKIWNLVPLSNHGINDILLEKKGDKVYLGKWQHSLVMLSPDRKEVYGFVVVYEREGENNDIYPTDSLHLKSLSISEEHQRQGFGRKLVSRWLTYNKEVGYSHLKGKLAYSTQTNGVEWNAHVQKFYQSFGFKMIGSKQYENKIDNVYFIYPW